MYNLVGEDFCIAHSKSENAHQLRKHFKPYTEKHLLRILTRGLRNLEKLKDVNPIEKLGETRRLVQLIREFKKEEKTKEKDPRYMTDKERLEVFRKEQEEKQ
jgi:hypothetical protein